MRDQGRSELIGMLHRHTDNRVRNPTKAELDPLERMPFDMPAEQTPHGIDGFLNARMNIDVLRHLNFEPALTVHGISGGGTGRGKPRFLFQAARRPRWPFASCPTSAWPTWYLNLEPTSKKRCRLISDVRDSTCRRQDLIRLPETPFRDCRSRRAIGMDSPSVSASPDPASRFGRDRVVRPWRSA